MQIKKIMAVLTAEPRNEKVFYFVMVLKLDEAIKARIHDLMAVGKENNIPQLRFWLPDDAVTFYDTSRYVNDELANILLDDDLDLEDYVCAEDPITDVDMACYVVIEGDSVRFEGEYSDGDIYSLPSSSFRLQDLEGHERLIL